MIIRASEPLLPNFYDAIPTTKREKGWVKYYSKFYGCPPKHPDHIYKILYGKEGILPSNNAILAMAKLYGSKGSLDKRVIKLCRWLHRHNLTFGYDYNTEKIVVDVRK